MFSLICSWTNGWVNNRDAGDVRRHCAYYGVTVFKLTIFVLFDFEVWRMTLKNNRAPMPHQALCMISSPYINSNWSYGPETAKLGFDLCDIDLWPWPCAWVSLLSLVIIPENFMMIRWWEHSENVWRTERRMDGQTDGRTESFIELLGRS